MQDIRNSQYNYHKDEIIKDEDEDANDKIDLLFFTNNVENPSFLNALKQDYEIPPVISQIPKFQNGSADSTDGNFQVFSAMEYGSSHPFHKHDVAWLGQVTGARLWYLVPPNIQRQLLGPKVNACDYYTGKAKLPLLQQQSHSIQACIQKSGEVMYLPANWWHATCAIEPWSVGIGGQGGNPKKFEQDFSIPTATSSSSTSQSAIQPGKSSTLVEQEKTRINECIMSTIQKKKANKVTK